MSCLNDKKKIRQRVSPGKAHYYRLPVTKQTAQYKIPGMSRPLDLSRHIKDEGCVLPYLEVNQQGSSLYFKLDTTFNQFSFYEKGCAFWPGSSSTSSEFWFVNRGNGFCLTKARFNDSEADLYSEGIHSTEESTYNLSALTYTWYQHYASMDENSSRDDTKKMNKAGCINPNQISISPVIPDPTSFRKKSFLHKYVIK